MSTLPHTYSGVVGDSAAAADCREQLLALLAGLEFSSRDLHAVAVAFTEAVDNSLQHGCGGRSRGIAVSWEANREGVRIVVSDDGPGFRGSEPAAAAAAPDLDAAGGRGLLLMRAFMHRIEHNASGNSVRMWRARTAA